MLFRNTLYQTAQSEERSVLCLAQEYLFLPLYLSKMQKWTTWCAQRFVTFSHHALLMWCTELRHWGNVCVTTNFPYLQQSSAVAKQPQFNLRVALLPVMKISTEKFRHLSGDMWLASAASTIFSRQYTHRSEMCWLYHFHCFVEILACPWLCTMTQDWLVASTKHHLM